MSEIAALNQRPVTSGRHQKPETLIVVRRNDGRIIRAALNGTAAPADPVSIPPLPLDMRLWDELTQEYCSVNSDEVKAVFFVRTHEGNPTWHDRVSFFSGDQLASNLWVCVRMADGEVLEGRIVNDLRLLNNPGFWLWPADAFSNNLLIYIPKTAVLEFHVIALQSAQQDASLADAVRQPGRRSTVDDWTETFSLPNSQESKYPPR